MTGKQSRGITIAQLDALCGNLPGVARDIKWGDNLVLSVGAKTFVATRAEGREGGPLSLKVADERFLELTDQAGVIPAPCLARARCVSVTELRRFTTAELQALLLDACATVRAKLSKKAQRALGPLPTRKVSR